MIYTCHRGHRDCSYVEAGSCHQLPCVCALYGHCEACGT